MPLHSGLLDDSPTTDAGLRPCAGREGTAGRLENPARSTCPRTSTLRISHFPDPQSRCARHRRPGDPPREESRSDRLTPKGADVTCPHARGRALAMVPIRRDPCTLGALSTVLISGAHSAESAAETMAFGGVTKCVTTSAHFGAPGRTVGEWLVLRQTSTDAGVQACCL